MQHLGGPRKSWSSEEPSWEEPWVSHGEEDNAWQILQECPTLLALMVHLIDSSFKLHDILIFAKPFSKLSHTAINIEHAIKEGLASYGIGAYDKSAKPKVDTVRIIS